MVYEKIVVCDVIRLQVMHCYHNTIYNRVTIEHFILTRIYNVQNNLIVFLSGAKRFA